MRSVFRTVFRSMVRQGLESAIRRQWGTPALRGWRIGKHLLALFRRTGR